MKSSGELKSVVIFSLLSKISFFFSLTGVGQNTEYEVEVHQKI